MAEVKIPVPGRSYRGRMAYLTHGVGETGREAFHVSVHEDGSFDVWAAGEDCVPVLLTSDGLHQRYELLELSGDYR